MSRNIFEVIWKFSKNSIFCVILESLSQLKRNFDNFKSWNYPFLCVWWVTKSFELIKVPEVCFPGGALSAPPHVKCTKKYLMSNRVNTKIWQPICAPARNINKSNITITCSLTLTEFLIFCSFDDRNITEHYNILVSI